MSAEDVARLVQRIRTVFDLTQAEFADVLGVTVQTVNRWENEALVPKEEVQRTLEGLRNQLPLLERTKAELSAVRELMNVVDKEIRGLSFSIQDVFVHRRAFEQGPDHNAASIAEYRHLREAAYGRLVVVRDEETGEHQTFRIAWGSRGWGALSIYQRRAPLIKALMTARVGDSVSLGKPGREHTFVVTEVSVLSRHPGNVLLGNYDNFRTLDYGQSPGALPEHIEDLRQTWLSAREMTLASLRQRKTEDVLVFEEEPFRVPLLPSSRAALSERFFMRPTKAQEEAMRWPAEGHVLVTGAAGSGKTSVALGRAAMLCMPNEEGGVQFNAETCVGFVLSDQLAGYLEDLRKGNSLGLDRMPVRSFSRLRQDLLAIRGFVARGVKRDLEAPQDPFIGSLAFCRLIDRRMATTIARALKASLPSEPAALFPDGLTGIDDMHWKVLESSWADMLKGMEDALNQSVNAGSVRKLVLRIDEQRERFARRLEVLAPWDTPRLKDARRRVRDRIKGRVISAFDYPERYFEIAADMDFRDTLEHELASDGGAFEVSATLRTRAGDKKLSDGDIDCLLLLAHMASEGYTGRGGAEPIFSLAETPRYSHVFIDEVQDFTAVQVRLMALQADAQFRAVTAVGDFAQRLNRWGIKEAAHSGLEVDTEREVHLGFNKRQTRPLHDLADAYRITVIGDNRDVQGELSSENDEMPSLYVVGPNGEAVLLERLLIQTREDHPDYSIAVMCRDNQQAIRLEKCLHRELWANNLLSQVSADQQDAQKLCDAYHVHFTTALAAKGLEFDAVFVMDAGAYDLKDDVDCHALYVALSRPCRRLGVFCESMPAGELGVILKRHTTVEQ